MEVRPTKRKRGKSNDMLFPKRMETYGKSASQSHYLFAIYLIETKR